VSLAADAVALLEMAAMVPLMASDLVVVVAPVAFVVMLVLEIRMLQL
jgi:hypothetical protein